MNTPAHLLLGAACFGRRDAPRLAWAAMAGSILPDVSLYLMASVSLYVLNIEPQVVFRELYYSDAWQTVFAIDNSVFLWGALLGFAIWLRSAWAIALTAAALLHLFTDFPLHHNDGRAHFWPLSNWIFQSPVSYWDVRYGAGWIGPLEILLSVICAVIIWVRRPGWIMAGLTALLLAAELMVARVWLFVFSAG
jgi:membrane-bound metal-dependent hydrolase YbcI (DUF457 family)